MRQRTRSEGFSAVWTAVALLAAILFVSPASAQNLLTNGSFDGINGTAGSAWSGCVNCWNGSSYATTQQINGKLSTGAAGAGIAGWSMTDTTNNHSNYAFVLTAAQANSSFSGDSGTLNLATTVTASPNGGNFVAMDGGYEMQTLYQSVGSLSLLLHSLLIRPQPSGCHDPEVGSRRCREGLDGSAPA